MNESTLSGLPAHAVRWNATGTEYPRDSSIPDLFAVQAAKRPDAIAISATDSHPGLTYSELDEQSDRLTAHLVLSGVTSGSAVAVCLDRSVEMIVSMLGVLKAGACYLPVDPAYPADRIRYMLADSAATAVIGETEQGAGILKISPVQLQAIVRQPLQRPAPRVKSSAQDTAYLMYTSGSTGEPKGVEVLHRGIVRLVRNTNYIDIAPDDVVAQVSHPCFDATTFEIWGPLLNGAQIAILSRDVILSPVLLAGALRRQGVTILWMTASLFNTVAMDQPQAFSSLRTLLAGGDALDARWVRKVLREGPPARFVNGYGPTECTVFSVCHLIEEVGEEDATVPIGRPISNSQAYILGPDLLPVAPGVKGELYLGGDGLARGYLNRPDLTAAAFIRHPFLAPGERLYKTGDYASWREDGLIDFRGRIDRQIKLRGFRIELDEIESALREHPEVAECAVLVQDLPTGKQLSGYASRIAGSSLTHQELRAFVTSRVPDHMIPSRLHVLDALPLNGPGKIDRAALVRLEEVPASPERTAAAETSFQSKLIDIWEYVLGVRIHSIDDHFFEVGGSSLLVALVESQIRRRIGIPVTVTDLFRYTTIRALAAHLDTEKSGASASSPGAVSGAATDRARNQAAALERMRRAGGRAARPAQVPGGEV